MNESEQNQLVKHMEEFPDDTWDEHAEWATGLFGKTVTTDECCKLYMTFCF